MPKPDISVSIVNYNSTEFLLRCLHSIEKQSTNLFIETLIADNSSKDFDPEQIYQIVPHASVTVNRQNKGFAYAHNQNFAHSTSDYFLLLNPDTILTDGSLHGIIDIFARFRNVAIVGPGLLSSTGKHLESVTSFPTITSAFFELLLFRSAPTKPHSADTFLRATHQRYVECINGAALAVRSHVYKSLSGLDPHFFMYFEEVDFCKRLRESTPYKIVSLPGVKVFHYHGRSSIQTDVRQTVYYESYYRYFKKHHCLKTSLFIRGIIILNTMVRLLGIQVKYFPIISGWQSYSKKTLSTFRLLLWGFGLRKSSRLSSECNK
jgi:GT2 family glycosyltransferase